MQIHEHRRQHHRRRRRRWGPRSSWPRTGSGHPTTHSPAPCWGNGAWPVTRPCISWVCFRPSNRRLRRRSKRVIVI